MKTKTIFLVLLFLAVKTISYAQLATWPDTLLMESQARDYGARFSVDTCDLSVMYNYEFVVDKSKNNKRSTRTVLEVGNNLNRYYSNTSEEYDKVLFDILVENDKTEGNGVRLPKLRNKNEYRMYIDVYTYPKQNERLVSTRIKDKEYQYREPIEPFGWKILNETDSVLGYLCQKAVTEFRGRTWNVWFTMELPYNYGPWKLGGLPGMILKAEDSERLHVIEAIGIERAENRLIYEYSDKAEASFARNSFSKKHIIVKSKRKNVAKLWRRLCINPFTFMDLSDPEIITFMNRAFNASEVDLSLPDRFYPKLELDM